MAEQDHAKPRKYAGLSWPQWTVVILVIGGLGALADILGWLNVGPSSGHQTLPTPVTTEAPVFSTTTGTATTGEASSESSEVDTTSPSTELISRFLSDDLEPSDSASLETGVVSIDGKSHPHSLKIYAAFAGPGESYATFVLGRHYRRFQAVLGIEDASPSQFKASIEVSVGGKRRFVKEVRKGQAYPINLDVTDAYELSIRVITLVGPEYAGYGAFGDAQLLGHPNEVPPTSVP
jgi:hypothetical protein